MEVPETSRLCGIAGGPAYNGAVHPWIALFDVDGTLIDAAGAGRRAVGSAISQVFGASAARISELRVPFAGRTDGQIFREMATGVGVEDSAFDREIERLHAAYAVELARELERPHPGRRVLPGAREVLAALDGECGVPLGLLTGNLELGARIKLRHFSLERYFPTGGFGSDSTDRREIARTARRRVERWAGIEVPPERVVVVGDTENDVDCALANGFRAVAVASGGTPRERLAACGADVVLDGLGDLEATLAALVPGGALRT